MKDYIHIELVKAKPYENIDIDKNLNGTVRKGYTVSTDDNDNLTRFVNEDEFEKHYTSVDNMSSYHALYMLMNGYKVRRKVWDDRCYIMICKMYNKINLMLYYDELDDLDFHVVTLLTDDLLANDWQLVKEETINYKGVEIEYE